MSFSESLNNRVRELLTHLPAVEEKHMFGGVCYMVDNKMCVGIVKDELMCRIDPALTEKVLEMDGVRPMDFTGKRMQGFVFVDEPSLRKTDQLQYWVNLCLEFNPKAQKSKKKPAKGK